MAIGDPIACMIGKRFPVGPYKFGVAQKTMAGSFAFFITAFLISILFLSFTNEALKVSILPAAIYLALGTTIAEGLTGKGYDNLTIPLAASLILFLL